MPEARAELAGMREVFAHVAAVAKQDMLDGRAYGNIVLAGSDRPLPLGASKLIDATLPRRD